MEFGAWDGIHYSNSFALVERHNWNAVYIEGDKKKYNDLSINFIINIIFISNSTSCDRNYRIYYYLSFISIFIFAE